MRLENKFAIVTGGAAGIGEAIVHKFVREGAAVLVADLPDMPVQDTVDFINGQGGRAVAFLGDMSEEADAAACVQTAIDAFGRVDILANNAGVYPQMGNVVDWDVENVDYVFKNNSRSAFLMSKHVIPYLRESRGAIVYTGSIAGLRGIPQIAPYSGSKAFVHALMQAVSQEEARYGVRANAICPGAITSAWNTPGAGGPVTEEMVKASCDMAPLGRTGTPEEMANAACFLASDEASYITGSFIVADGGVTIAQGLPGAETLPELRKEPEVTLELRHRADGFIGKKVTGGVGKPG